MIEGRVQAQTPDGRWVMAIPEPYFLLIGYRCHCRKYFLKRVRYEEHYAFAHLLEVDGWTPSEETPNER